MGLPSSKKKEKKEEFVQHFDMLLDFFLKTEQAAIYILHQDNLVPLSPLDTEWSSGCGCLPSLSLSLSPLLSQSQTEWPSCYGYSLLSHYRQNGLLATATFLLSPLQTEWSSCCGYLSPLSFTDKHTGKHVRQRGHGHTQTPGQCQ